jgi:tRNA-splicing ligase RtcB (3'-phosphate/5'-hydroxy nucleic acid ligase)
MNYRHDPLEARARELAIADGIDPDSPIPKPGSHRRRMPAWCAYRDAARFERERTEQASLRDTVPAKNAGTAPLEIFGVHEPTTVEQMKNCMRFGSVVGGVLAADGHLGYAQPVGGVIAYENQVSISGVGYDIACGNAAARLDMPFAAIADKVGVLAKDIAKTISFGLGRANNERVEHPLFDDDGAWVASGMAAYRQKAAAQLGTVGSGNHYVDLLRDEDGFVWIGVHFGSRGLGHTSAAKYLKLAGGKEGINVAPALVATDTDLGRSYLAAMELAGRYAYAGRDWVVERVRQITGGTVTFYVHNHHNYAWREGHGDRDLWVVRKGATPAFPGQQGFVGGSMGDDAVILEGVESDKARTALYSTVHGAGRVFGRKEAKRRLSRYEMDAWLRDRGVKLIGADLDESPMAYRRLPDVLAAHAGTVKVLHVLHPFVVVMAGAAEVDPFKD